MLTRRRVIAGKIEAVEGTAEVVTVAEAGIVAIDPKFDLDVKMYDRANVMLNSLSKLPSVPGARMGKITFSAELKGSGVAYSALVKPAIGIYLRACGFAETIVTTVGSETATYLPASTGVPSLSISMYDDGMIKTIAGARGTVKFDGKLGEAVIASFEFQGIYSSVAAGAMISPTLEASIPPILLNANLTINAAAAICESFSADMGNQVSMRTSVNAVTGYVSATINDRKPTAKLDPEMSPLFPSYTNWLAGTPVAVSIGPLANGNYNKFTIVMPKLIATKVGEADRNGNEIANTDFAMCMNTGDDEISIVFSK
jgi:hypothetical protein